MAGSTINLGNQTVLWKYSTPLVGQVLSEGMADILAPGVYTGLIGSIYSLNLLSFTPGTIMIKDSGYAGTSSIVRINFATSFGVTVTSGGGTFLVLRYDWQAASINYAYVLQTNTPAATDVILCALHFTSTTCDLVDNNARSISTASLLGVDSSELWVSPGTGLQVNVNATTILSTTSAGLPQALTVPAVSALTVTAAATTAIVLNVQTGVVTAQAASTPLTSYQVLCATVTVPAAYTQVLPGQIVNSIWRRDMSHASNPLAHGIVNGPATIATGSITDGTRTTIFYNSQYGVQNESPAVLVVAAAVSGMPYTGATWLLQVQAQGNSTTGMVSISAMDMTLFPGQIFSLRHLNGTWDALWVSDALKASSGPRNKLINGNFDFWQRGTASVTVSTAGTAYSYLADKWALTCAGTASSNTLAQGVFTVGQSTIPNNPVNFQAVTIGTLSSDTANGAVYLSQNIESVSTLEGKSVVISFWMFSSTAAPVAVEVAQNFGAGGSPSATVYTPMNFVVNNVPSGSNKITLTTGWVKYTATVAIPSISGKTVGTTPFTSSLALNIWFSAGTAFNARTGTLGLGTAGYTFNIAQVQIEEGLYPTPFEVRPYALELSLCRRYCQLVAPQLGAAATNQAVAFGQATTALLCSFFLHLDAPLRVVPTLVQATVANWQSDTGVTTASVTAFSLGARSTIKLAEIVGTGTFTIGTSYLLQSSTSAPSLLLLHADF